MAQKLPPRARDDPGRTGKKAGVTQRLISDFERNKVVIRIDTLYRILKALGLILATIDPSIEPEQTDEEYPW